MSTGEPFIELTIKNTFIAFVDTSATTAPSKRSTSLPRYWKPVSQVKQVEHPAFASDASTADSSDDASTAEEFASGAHSNSDNDSEPKAVLCLNNAILKLSSKASAFTPGREMFSLPSETRKVLKVAFDTLSARPKVFNVHMSEGILGGTTTIVASYIKGSLKPFQLAKTLSIVQMTLIEAAAASSTTYIVGYMNQRFNEVGPSGFSTRIGSVPASQNDVTCWESYQKGFCPRQATCAWCHPQSKDLAVVVVVLNEIAQYQ